jgi:hypothetical protein
VKPTFTINGTAVIGRAGIKAHMIAKAIVGPVRVSRDDGAEFDCTIKDGRIYIVWATLAPVRTLGLA